MSDIEKDQQTWQSRIVIDQAILAGKPLVNGTRLSVEFILDLMSQGWTEAEIIQNYPSLTRDDIRACLAYARDTLGAERIFPLGA